MNMADLESAVKLDEVRKAGSDKITKWFIVVSQQQDAVNKDKASIMERSKELDDREMAIKV